MSGHPLATPGDPDGYLGSVLAVRNLIGRQAVTLEQAWATLLRREGGPEAMPAEARVPTAEALAEIGYVEHLVTPVGGRGRARLWIRPYWLIETVEEVPLD